MFQLPNRNAIPPNGGVLLQKMPDPIPWAAFIASGLRVLSDGKPLVVILDPQPIEDHNETLELLRLLMASSMPKPGPLAWDTVPERVRRHFRVAENPK